MMINFQKLRKTATTTSATINKYFVIFSLEKIILGSSLKQARCFNYQSCINVKEIHCKAITPPDCGFASDIYNDATLYVPKGCYEAYYTAVGWRNFKTIIEE